MLAGALLIEANLWVSVLPYFLFLLPDDMFQLIDHQFNCLIELMTLGPYMGGMAPAKIYITFD